MSEKGTKQQRTESINFSMENTNQGNETASHSEDPIQSVANNTALQVPLVH